MPHMMHQHMLKLLGTFLHDLKLLSALNERVKKCSNFDLDHVRITNNTYDNFARYFARSDIDPKLISSILSLGDNVCMEIKTRINIYFHSINLLLVPHGEQGMTIYVANKMSDLMIFYTANRNEALDKILKCTHPTMASQRIYDMFDSHGFTQLAKIKIPHQRDGPV